MPERDMAALLAAIEAAKRSDSSTVHTADDEDDDGE